MVIWCTQNVRRDGSPIHIKVTQEQPSHYECFTPTETVRTIRDEVYTPAAHSLFNVRKKTVVLISRSACPLSIQCVCKETGVLIYRSICTLSVQCAHIDGCVN